MSPVENAAGRLARLRDSIDSGATVSDEDVAFLCDCLGRVRKSEQRGAAECLAGLARQDPQREVKLFEGLESADARVRWGAAYATSLLGKFPSRAIDTAIDLLGTDDRDLRWAAVDLVRRAAAGAEPGVLRRLCDIARTGTFLQRRMALYALRDVAVRDPMAIVAAEEALAESDVELRLAGLAALVQISADSSRAAEQIIGLLEDPELRVQRAAAAALGFVGCRSPHVIRAIERALVCSDESVRRAARRSFERLGERDT